MTKFPPLVFSLLLGASVLSLAGDTPAAKDDAAQAAYGTEWKDGSNGGSGFGPWKLQSEKGSGESNAGFYIAAIADQGGAVKDGKAFAMYANGINFEATAAFRAFTAPLAVGQSFILTYQVGPFEKKFATDAPGNAVGVALRTGQESSSADDYNKGLRCEFGNYTGSPNYQIYDGEASHDSGVPFSEGGVKLKFTMVTADTYDLDVTTLADQKTTSLKGRKFFGKAGGTVDSFCVFDRNWEKYDAFFNSFQVIGGPAPK